jgi:hypothetical protein
MPAQRDLLGKAIEDLDLEELAVRRELRERQSQEYPKKSQALVTVLTDIDDLDREAKHRGLIK